MQSFLPQSQSSKLKLVVWMLCIFGIITFFLTILFSVMSFGFLNGFGIFFGAPVYIAMVIFSFSITGKFIQSGIDLYHGRLQGLRVARGTTIVAIILYALWALGLHDWYRYDEGVGQYYWFAPALFSVTNFLLFLFLKNIKEDGLV